MALRFPRKIEFSNKNIELPVADSNHNQIGATYRSGQITRRIGNGNTHANGSKLDETEFFQLQGLCYHNGVMWVVDTENHFIRWAPPPPASI